METDPLISGLLRRRSEIAGDIAHLESRVDAMRSDLAKLDAALGVLGHEVEGEFLPVRKPGTAGLFRRKELPRLIIGHLRGKPDGVTVSDIALAITRDKVWETDDGRFQAVMRDKISRNLTKLKALGRADMLHADGDYLWRLSQGTRVTPRCAASSRPTRG